MDVRRLLGQNKIVMLRFGPDTGPVGASLARMILREYYKAVYATGLTMPDGAYSFACLDEFQDFAELGAGRFSDTNFIAQAREFNAIFLASTQSMAALANRGNSHAAVSSFVSNCNARVLFYTDDLFTQYMAAQYDENIRLNTLCSGEAFVVQYDTERRNHSFGKETLQQTYEATRDILQQAGCGKNDTTTSETETAPLPLFTLLEQAESEHKAAMEEKARADSVEMQKNNENAPKATDSSSAEKFFALLGEGESPVTMEQTQPAEDQEGADSLRKSFPQYFSEDGQVCMAVPVGWLPYTEKAFRAFSGSGLKLVISAIIEKGGALVVSTSEPFRKQSLSTYYHTGERVMNALLRGTRELCPLCGGAVARPQVQQFWNAVDGPVSVCVGCLAKYGMLLSMTDAEASGDITSEE
jgi:hypothetical protein